MSNHTISPQVTTTREDCGGREVRMILDVREVALKKVFEREDTQIVLKALDVGDIQIVVGNSRVRCIVERKTWTDLAASIVDGRWREQKMRLLALKAENVPDCRVMYLVEGEIDPACRYAVPPSTMKSALWNTIVRDDIHVVYSLGVDDSAVALTTLLHKCTEEEALLAKRNCSGETQTNVAAANAAYCGTIKTRKKDNNDPKTCFVSQLSCVPGVSTTIAMRVADLYPDWMSLICSIQNDQALGELSKLLISAPNAKIKRKLGTVVANRIVSYVGTPTTTTPHPSTTTNVLVDQSGGGD